MSVAGLRAIPKVARERAGLERPFLGFDSARSAFRAFLVKHCASDRAGVLLPAYVGWSPREGSGVFDPVRDLGVPFSFYQVTDRLEIDVDDLRAKLERDRPRVLLLIHYFGFPDPAYDHVVALGRDHGAAILEDEAHAMLTDLVGGTTGRLGDASLVSLHKLLPVDTGGGLLVNPIGQEACDGLVGSGDPPSPWAFDLARLARHRTHNARRLHDLMAGLRGRVDPLWELQPAIVPQTYPVLVRTTSRDVLYERMNAAGFGVVSLYHTLVDAISPSEFPASFRLSRQVLNLPVHQEASEESLVAMVEELDRLTAGGS